MRPDIEIYNFYTNWYFTLYGHTAHYTGYSGVKAGEGQLVDDDNATKESFLFDIPTSQRKDFICWFV